ncbi:MAG: hypothetical protein JXB18_12565 [Sedimentisphaerales bacterium]|nr:hypothetical protein [Sedimentisphaerales bacterium]
MGRKRQSNSVEWKLEDGRLNLDLTILPNSTATVILPDGTTHRAGSGVRTFRAMMR